MNDQNPSAEQNIIDIQFFPDVLAIIHLDDSFMQSRLNTITNLLLDPPKKLSDLLVQTNNFDTKNHVGELKNIMAGMTDLVNLIIRLRHTIRDYKHKKPDMKIFLLNFINHSDARKIYYPYESELIEVQNSGYVKEKNLEQTKSFINVLYSSGFTPERKINIEIVGVYRQACVKNIDYHLENLIKAQKYNIEKWVKKELTL